MKLLIFLILVFNVLYADLQELEKSENFTLEIIYDSLEPGCERFIVEQYIPVLNRIKKYVQLFTCPFGQAKIIDNEKIDYCARGPVECFINFVHLCISDVLDIPIQTKIDYLFCTIKAPNPLAHVRMCANANGINWDMIYTCIPTVHHLIKDKLKKLIQLTGKKRRYLPIIYFNGHYIPELQQPATMRFFETVCDALKDQEKPKECEQFKDGKDDINIYYFVLMSFIGTAIVSTGLYVAIQFAR